MNKTNRCFFVLICSLLLLSCDFSAGAPTPVAQQNKPTVTILAPANNSQVPVDQPTAIQVSAADAQGVTRLEVKVDGVLVSTVQSLSPQGQPSLDAVQAWTFGQAGSHVVSAHAYNTAGQVSEVVAVTVLAVSESASASPTSLPTEPSMPLSPPQTLEGCSLLTAAEAEAILGEPAGPSQAMEGGCAFNNASNSLYVVSVGAAQGQETGNGLQGLAFVLGLAGVPLDETRMQKFQLFAEAQDYRGFFDELVAAAAGTSVKSQLVEDLGDVAWWAWFEAGERRQGALAVVRGPTLVNINLVVAAGREEAAMLDAARALAETVFGRLPASFMIQPPESASVPPPPPTVAPPESPSPVPPSPTVAPPESPSPVPPPVIVSFAANPTSITAGGSATLQWEVSGATSVKLDQGIGPVALGGSCSISPASTTTYKLTAKSAGGTATQEVVVQVNKPVQATLGSQLSTIAYLDLNWKPHVYTFVIGNDGRLFVNYCDGTQWRWADQGLSAGGKSGSVAAINYYESASQRIYAFTTGKKALRVNYWDGGQWRWADQGQPQNASVSNSPGAITFREADTQRIYAFVTGSSHLYVNYWDGGQWRWADQGSPTSHALSSPGVITYLEGNTQRIYAFVSSSNGTLFVNYWDGGQWRWADQGQPQNTAVGSSPGVISFLEGGSPRIYAFVRGKNNRLHVNYWDGGQWHWADQGRPANVNVASTPSVITFQEGNSQHIYAFVRGGDKHLHVNYWDGGKWHWADQGKPANANVISVPSAITYREAGVQRIYAFVMGSDGHLHVNYWDGGQWRWADQGTP